MLSLFIVLQAVFFILRRRPQHVSDVLTGFTLTARLMHISKVARHPPDSQHDLCRAVTSQVTDGSAPPEPEDGHHASALHSCSEDGTLSPSTVRSQRSATPRGSAMSIVDDASDGRGLEPLDRDHEHAADGATVRPAMVRGGLLKQSTLSHDHEEVLPALRLSEPK